MLIYIFAQKPKSGDLGWTIDYKRLSQRNKESTQNDKEIGFINESKQEYANRIQA